MKIGMHRPGGAGRASALALALAIAVTAGTAAGQSPQPVAPAALPSLSWVSQPAPLSPATTAAITPINYTPPAPVQPSPTPVVYRQTVILPQPAMPAAVQPPPVQPAAYPIPQPAAVPNQASNIVPVQATQSGRSSGYVLADSPGGAAALMNPPDLAPGPVVDRPGNEPLGTVSGATSGSPEPKMAGQWKNGLFFESEQKDFTAHVGGVLQFDGIWYDAQASQNYPGPGSTGPFRDAVDIRRARIRTEGTMYKSVDWVLEVDFAAGGFNPTGQVPTQQNTFWTPVPTDMWGQIKDVPFVGTVRIGQQKEPYSLERLNSARLLNFMERSFLTDASEISAFNNNRSPGISVFRNFAADDRVYTSIGFFKNITDLYGYGIGDGQYAVTGRVTGLPIWNEDEQYFWHVGGSMSYRDPVNEVVQLRVRPNIRVNPIPFVNLIANTGPIPTNSENNFAIETAAVYKGFTFQSEYQALVLYGATDPVINQPVGNLVFEGWYAEGLYFLTGESRPFNRKAAIFGRVTPNNPLIMENGHAKGLGAWEVACRVSRVSLNDKSIIGGQLNAVTLGLNWYWNANTRMQFNYDYTYRNDTASVNDVDRNIIHSFGTRFQYDF